jgi:4-aminobutyrate aminotransferase-like enzyme
LERLSNVKPPWGKVRGLGLMLGIEVLDAQGQPDAARAGQLVEQGLRDGLIFLSGGTDQNILSFTPPFLITREEMDYLAERLQDMTKIIY